MADANPTLRQRQLANRLRELRKQSGLNLAEVAEQILLSPAQVSRIENAKRIASPRDVRALCKLYGVPEAELLKLAKESRKREWWLDHDDPDFRQMIGLESEASEIIEYETTTIPGLLQTEGYARAIFKGYLPRIDPEVLESRTQGRMKRQELLYRQHPPIYWVLLDESVLHRHVGGLQVMADQLEQLTSLAELPQVNVLVIPFTVGAHMGFDTAFRMLRFPQDADISDTLFTEDSMGGETHEDYGPSRARIERYREIIDHLRAAAANPTQSIEMIRAKAMEFAQQYNESQAPTSQ
ncbi:helix-turn-helix domain-containing protein [Nonomuraea sp. NPDC050556]|uniref:helix-turn-helix domain-containing protein n=1 Tax=Nonomuraea sp. NPDC050556 TaxID=3364369 RepID=UPI00379FFC13